MSRELAFSLDPSHKDIKEDHFSAGGPGGQNVNRRKMAVRFTHLPSGAKGECREERSQKANRKRAWVKMCNDPKFRYWVDVQLGKIRDEEQYLAEAMKPEHMKIEYREHGKWVEQSG